MPLLNGIDIYERVCAATSFGIVLPACIYISALRQAPGCVVHVGGKGNIIAGDDPRHKGFDAAPLTSLMAKADIPFEWQADSFPALWKKYLFIASYGLVTAMSGKSFGQILESSELSAQVQSILKEIYAIATAKGVAMPDSVIMGSFENARNFPYETTTSFARDVKVPGKPNESELFGATILRLGRELGIPTPATRAVHEAIVV
jgi:2-dehydropantoate 2-reductase